MVVFAWIARLGEVLKTTICREPINFFATRSHSRNPLSASPIGMSTAIAAASRANSMTSAKDLRTAWSSKRKGLAFLMSTTIQPPGQASIPAQIVDRRRRRERWRV